MMIYIVGQNLRQDTVLRGYCTPNQKLAYLVLYLKIINTFLKNTHATYSKLSKELKNSIKI